MQEIRELIDPLIGLDKPIEHLTLLQVSIRAVLTYFAGYMMLRFGKHRFLGKNTAFDVVLGFIFGATLSRAINGAAPFLDTVLAGVILVSLHWLTTSISFRSDRADVLLNGEAVLVIRDGQIQWENMRQHRINERLLLENLRTNAEIDDPELVQSAFLERSGEISVIPRNGEVRVIEIGVEEGVKTVRVEFRTG